MLKLKSHIMVVEGAINAALYDLKTGNVFQINSKCLEIVREFEKGSSLSRFPDDQGIIQSFIEFGLISDKDSEEKFDILINNNSTQVLQPLAFVSKNPVKFVQSIKIK